MLPNRLATRILFNMPATRSSTRSMSATGSPVKRKLESEVSSLPSPKKPKHSSKPVIPTASGTISETEPTKLVVPASNGTTSEPDFVPADAVLTFSFEDAKKHLINADHRFEDVFNRLECKPFRELEQVHPFR